MLGVLQKTGEVSYPEKHTKKSKTNRGPTSACQQNPVEKLGLFCYSLSYLAELEFSSYALGKKAFFTKARAKMI